MKQWVCKTVRKKARFLNLLQGIFMQIFNSLHLIRGSTVCQMTDCAKKRHNYKHLCITQYLCDSISRQWQNISNHGVQVWQFVFESVFWGGKEQSDSLCKFVLQGKLLYTSWMKRNKCTCQNSLIMPTVLMEHINFFDKVYFEF